MAGIFLPNNPDDVGVVPIIDNVSLDRFVTITIGQNSTSDNFFNECLIQKIEIINKVNHKTTLSLNNRQYLYIFGDDVGSINITGVLFRKLVNYDDTTQNITYSGIPTAHQFYQDKAISKTIYTDKKLSDKVISIIFKGNSSNAVFKGFLIGMTYAMNDPDRLLTQVNMSILPIRAPKQVL